MKLALAALILTARAFATPYTVSQSATQQCQHNNYVINGQNVSRYGCNPMQAVVNGAGVSQAMYIDETANSDDSGGTFTGGYFLDQYTQVTFTGTYVGHAVAPTSLLGSWSTGNVSMTFSTHKVGGGRYGTRTVPYLQSGFGNE